VPYVEFTIEGRIARVHLNRPEALNAITPEMDDALAAAWKRINADDEIWAALLTAQGSRAFCAGADVSSGLSDKSTRSFGGGLTGIGGPLVKLNKPLVAAVQGHAVGGGFELAMCADILVIDETAQFRLPEVQRGLINHSGVLHRASRKLPLNVALDLILTGRPMLADEALRLGLASRLVSYAELILAAHDICETIARASPLATQAAKATVTEGLEFTLEQALGRAYSGIWAFVQSQDGAEALAALQEKRAPMWVGR
jgi:enoyl-CoA hydratase/carnithine racemase